MSKDMSEDNALLYEVNDHIGVITLNRPEAMNSLTYQLYADLEDTVRSSQARVLVITGAGRAFCAGDDMKQILGNPEPPPAEFRARAKATGGLTPAADALLYTDIPVRGVVAIDLRRMSRRVANEDCFRWTNGRAPLRRILWPKAFCSECSTASHNSVYRLG